MYSKSGSALKALKRPFHTPASVLCRNRECTFHLLQSSGTNRAKVRALAQPEEDIHEQPVVSHCVAPVVYLAGAKGSKITHCRSVKVRLFNGF